MADLLRSSFMPPSAPGVSVDGNPRAVAASPSPTAVAFTACFQGGFQALAADEGTLHLAMVRPSSSVRRFSVRQMINSRVIVRAAGWASMIGCGSVTNLSACLIPACFTMRPI